ncbi:MAG: 8-amino-7-oxononanoate synthase [Methylococcaceae bacterium NSP1-2]|nr:aminotransferase class I/II-fold pyridoxal phosphate-dependent enzyme [Methylococcaceae bacterium]OYV19625.1 MAG: 8-amino-7-oxononanoate synthase [Methylococcaceae bacterium NSP1-2]
MIDFSSALYLGMYHSSQSLPPWQQLTLGVPAALAEPPSAGRVAKALAELQGCKQAVLMPSTLHLFWDIFGMLSKQAVTIYLDEEAYAIVQWGAERAAACGVTIRKFRHHDPDSLFSEMTRQAHSRKRPVVVTDGFCPACGKLAPIHDYLTIVRHFRGLLVLDDTQALGILGEQLGTKAPYGFGGGGTLRWSGVSGSDILVGASLAKGFGVPIATLAGSEFMIQQFIRLSDTRVHCSPPSVAVIQAAEHALVVNQTQGNRLRQQLAQRIRQFREGLRLIGLASIGGWFPVQTLHGIIGTAAVRLHQQLAQRGIQTVLSQPRNATQARLSFLITARHSVMEIDRCIEMLDVLNPTYLKKMPADWLPRGGTLIQQEVHHESRIRL